jgi:hypothetical protein
MLVSIYFSEKRDNLLLVRSTAILNAHKYVEIESGKKVNFFLPVTKEELKRLLIEREYELIGFFNE